MTALTAAGPNRTEPNRTDLIGLRGRSDRAKHDNRYSEAMVACDPDRHASDPP